MNKKKHGGGRPRTLDDETMKELERRFPNENTADLAAELGIPVGSVKWHASKNGWRKTGRYWSSLGGQKEAKDPVAEVAREMEGGARRHIHSGLLVVKGRKTVHFAK